jgi:hypothetical protein
MTGVIKGIEGALFSIHPALPGAQREKPIASALAFFLRPEGGRDRETTSRLRVRDF